MKYIFISLLLAESAHGSGLHPGGGIVSGINVTNASSTASQSIFQDTGKHLDTFLFDHYDKQILPHLGDASTTIVIKMMLSLRTIIEFQQKLQILTTSAWMTQRWNDPRLRWKREEHQNRRLIHVRGSRIWTPSIFLYNNADEQYHDGPESPLTTVWYNGDVDYTYPVIYSTYCTVNTFYFPFDEQNCSLAFISLAYDMKTLDIHDEDRPHIDSIRQHSEWHLEDVDVKKSYTVNELVGSGKFPTVTFSVKLRRSSSMLFWFLYVPNMVIHFLTIIQFLLPCDSTEKVTLGTSIFISMIVYLKLIAGLLPMSRDVPIIVYYMSSTLTMVTVSLLLTTIISELHYSGSRHNRAAMPLWAKNFFFNKVSRFVGLANNVITEVQAENVPVVSSQTSLELIEDEDAIENEDKPWLFQTRKKSPSHQLPSRPAWILHSEMSREHPPRSSSLHPDWATIVPPALRYRISAPYPLQEPARRQRRYTGEVVWAAGERVNSLGMNPDILKENRDLILLKILRGVKRIAAKHSIEDHNNVVRDEWQRLAMLVGRIFFFIYLFVTIIIWIIVFSTAFVNVASRS